MGTGSRMMAGGSLGGRLAPASPRNTRSLLPIDHHPFPIGHTPPPGRESAPGSPRRGPIMPDVERPGLGAGPSPGPEGGGFGLATATFVIVSSMIGVGILTTSGHTVLK